MLVKYKCIATYSVDNEALPVISKIKQKYITKQFLVSLTGLMLDISRNPIDCDIFKEITTFPLLNAIQNIF